MATKDKKGGTEQKPKSEKAGKSLKLEVVKALPVKKPLLGTETMTPVVSVPPPVGVKGVDRARRNRLKKAGIEIDRCPVTNLYLDIGPRANAWLKPTNLNGEIMSWLGRVILESEITPEELDKIGNILRKK